MGQRGHYRRQKSEPPGGGSGPGPGGSSGLGKRNPANGKKKVHVITADPTSPRTVHLTGLPHPCIYNS